MLMAMPSWSMRYGVFFEVGCESRVLCKSLNLLRPVAELLGARCTPQPHMFHLHNSHTDVKRSEIASNTIENPSKRQ